jgi:hypothetical protein
VSPCVVRRSLFVHFLSCTSSRGRERITGREPNRPICAERTDILHQTLFFLLRRCCRERTKLPVDFRRNSSEEAVASRPTELAQQRRQILINKRSFLTQLKKRTSPSQLVIHRSLMAAEAEYNSNFCTTWLRSDNGTTADSRLCSKFWTSSGMSRERLCRGAMAGVLAIIYRSNFLFNRIAPLAADPGLASGETPPPGTRRAAVGSASHTCTAAWP